MEEKRSSLALGFFTLLLLALATLVFLSSCTEVKKTIYGGETPDSVYVASVVDAALNPSFTSVQEIKTFQNNIIEEYSVEETFRNMPENVLINVSSVCLKNLKSVTTTDIIGEYLANKQIYDNLPKTDPPAYDKHADSTTKPKPVVSYRYEIDTVNGKPQRALIKEERTYEE